MKGKTDVISASSGESFTYTDERPLEASDVVEAVLLEKTAKPENSRRAKSQAAAKQALIARRAVEDLLEQRRTDQEVDYLFADDLSEFDY